MCSGASEVFEAVCSLPEQQPQSVAVPSAHTVVRGDFIGSHYYE